MSKRVNNSSGAERKRILAKRIGKRTRTGLRCFYCGQSFTEEMPPTFDHYIPYKLWRTGRHDALVLACWPCNEQKADALPWPLVWVLLAWAGREAHHREPGTTILGAYRRRLPLPPPPP